MQKGEYCPFRLPDKREKASEDEWEERLPARITLVLALLSPSVFEMECNAGTPLGPVCGPVAGLQGHIAQEGTSRMPESAVHGHHIPGFTVFPAGSSASRPRKCRALQDAAQRGGA